MKHDTDIGRESWAAKSWSARATAWLHTEPHDLEVDGKDIVYHVNGFEKGFKIFGRTLSQMTTVVIEPGARFDEIIKQPTLEVYDRLVEAIVRRCNRPDRMSRRRNFLHEMGS